MVPRGGGTRCCGALTPGPHPSTENPEDTWACGFRPVAYEGKACQPVGVTTTCILPDLGAAMGRKPGKAEVGVPVRLSPWEEGGEASRVHRGLVTDPGHVKPV